MRRDATRAENADALEAANADRQNATDAAEEAQRALEAARAELSECREARKTAEKVQADALKPDEKAKLEGRIGELQQQLAKCRAAHGASKQRPLSGDHRGSSAALPADARGYAP